jgi:DNA-binding NarL/FixJ family response regulator
VASPVTEGAAPDEGDGHADAVTRAIRVAIVDDHPVVRDGTAALLAAQPGIEVAGTAGSLAEARILLASTDADVLLLDIRLGTQSGLNLLTPDPVAAGERHSADSNRPRPAIIVLTAYDYPQYAEAALRLGAAGFVLKTAPMTELLDAIRRAAGGGMAFGVRPRPSDRARLSRRELEVVTLVVEGRSNDEVGAALGIGAKTVETHLARLFERFSIASRTELATRALREGWLDLPPD